MPIDTKRSAINLFCKLAQADGEIVESEKELLEECIQELDLKIDLNTLIAEASEHSIKSLCSEISNLNDRFFIRVRCHMMVKVDGDVDTKEQAMLDQILSLLPLSDELETLLDNVLDFEEGQMTEPNFEAIELLYEDSSFSLGA